MLPSVESLRWMQILKIFLLFIGILLQNHFCKTSGTGKKHRLKSILFLSADEVTVNPTLPSDVVFQEKTETRLCFNIQANQSAACCRSEEFSCSTKIKRLNGNTYTLTVKEWILRKHDIVVLLNPTSNFSCRHSQLNKSTEFILNLHNCLKPGGRNIRMSLDHPCPNHHKDAQICTSSYKFEFGSKLISCEKIVPSELLRDQKPLNLTFHHSGDVASLNKTVNIMNNFSFYKVQMENSTIAFVSIGEVTGVIAKLPPKAHCQTMLKFGFTSNGDVKILKGNNNVGMELVVEIPKRANETAVKGNVTVLIFPGMNTSYIKFLNNKVLGIEMGENTFNPSIDIYYNNMNTSNFSASCMSLDWRRHIGKPGNNQNWTTDHCKTIKKETYVICSCSRSALVGLVMTLIKPEKTLNFSSSSDLNPDEAEKIMNKMDEFIKEMDNAESADIKTGNITGVIVKLPPYADDINFGFTSSGDVNILGRDRMNTNAINILIPKEATEMARRHNQAYIQIVLFKGMMKKKSDMSVLKNEVLGIEMRANISNLSNPINITYNYEEKTDEFKRECISWKGKDSIWNTNGCNTNEEGKKITCSCSHLTFFAIRLISSTTQVDSSGTQPEKTLTFEAPEHPLNSEQAANVMKNLSSFLNLMGNASTAAIKMGNILGVISRLPQQNQTNMDFGFTSTRNVTILKGNNSTGFAQTIHFPKQATEMAVHRNGSYSGVLRFPDIPKFNATTSLFNNEILGIDMGVNISNLSDTIDIHFSDVNTTGFNISCVSWDGRSKDGGRDKWITDGCLTNEANGSITCQCSHLTFFAILMTSGDEKISSSDIKTLTQITKAGCGVSMFFLGVALFMHFLIRKNKASQATKILMNLFSALFVLNFCFLINETIADLKIFAACVVMAAVLHYSMLATFTWFFLQALHFFFTIYKMPTGIKHYMSKICITGWVIPAMVVIGLLASSKYDYIAVSGANGTSVSMCWIPDSTVHLGVNIGYYSIVFIFTLTVFVVTVVQITHFSKQNQTQGSPKKMFFSLLGLFCLLGITWGFAFFSYGPLLLPSYYIFTILNSFQGFFLFVYYYVSSKIVPEDKQPPSTLSTSSNMYKSPYT